MFLPLHDSNPLRIIPLQAVTIALIAINVSAGQDTGPDPFPLSDPDCRPIC